VAKRKKSAPVIDDESAPGLTDLLNPPGFGHGLVERDHAKYPAEMFAPPTEIQLIPRSEWPDRIKERQAQKATGRDLRNRMANGKKHKSLDQNGQGYCWMYSVTHTVMYMRAVANQPYRRLSAHAGACKVKNFRDEGGWCGLGAKFVRENGIPSVRAWPEKSMSRSHDTAATWEDAKASVITEDWVDLTRQVYDQNLSFDMVASCLLQGVFCAVDFNWWAHSVCAIDIAEVEPGSYGLLIQNSWTDAWGDEGLGILRGNKAVPDGAVATRVVTGG
jgi:hypothetical protein